MNLKAVADPAPGARAKFFDEWGALLGGDGIASYEDGLEMIRTEPLDVVVLCIKGPLHYRFAMEAIRHSPARLVFLEKPAACSLRELDEITEAAKDVGKQIIVDYTRHWAPHMLHLQRRVRDGLLGEVLSVIGYCGGSLVLSETCHTLDTVCQFAGYDIKSVTATTSENRVSAPAGYEAEPKLVAALVNYQSGIVGLLNGRIGSKTGFSVEVIGTEGTLLAGMYIPTIWRDKEGNIRPTEELALPPPAGPFQLAYEQISEHLTRGAVPECSNSQFIPVTEATFAICQSGKTGRAISLPMEARDVSIYADG